MVQGFYLGRIKFLHIERTSSANACFLYATEIKHSRLKPPFAVRETESLGIRGAPEVPPLCRETQLSDSKCVAIATIAFSLHSGKAFSDSFERNMIVVTVSLLIQEPNWIRFIKTKTVRSYAFHFWKVSEKDFSCVWPKNDAFKMFIAILYEIGTFSLMFLLRIASWTCQNTRGIVSFYEDDNQYNDKRHLWGIIFLLKVFLSSNKWFFVVTIYVVCVILLVSIFKLFGWMFPTFNGKRHEWTSLIINV